MIRDLVRDLIEADDPQETNLGIKVEDALVNLFMNGKISIAYDPAKKKLTYKLKEEKKP